MATSSSYADSVKKGWLSRIMTITLRIPKHLPPGTICRSWVAKTLNRSEDFVKRNWNKDPSIAKWTANKRATMKVSDKKAKILFSVALQKRKVFEE